MVYTQNTKVAILISTKDRPDFLIRTLLYYAKLKSPHPVYIGDSSSPSNAQKITSAIQKLGKEVEVHYKWFSPGFEPTGEILLSVKERYVILAGDDDYEVPATLTKAAEFLENNPDYAAAGGSGLAFRLKDSGPYGELKSVREYPNRSLEAGTASQRLTDFAKDLFTITFTSVNRVENFKKIWVFPIPVGYTWGELFQVCYCAVAGKSKLIDGLGVVRQIHDKQWRQLSTVDWITSKDFYSFYVLFMDHISKKLLETDKVSAEQARSTVNSSLLDYILLAVQREKKSSSQTPTRTTLKTLKVQAGVRLPILKTIYRMIVPDNKLHMHFEALNPDSKYYKDFQQVADSFTGQDLQ